MADEPSSEFVIDAVFSLADNLKLPEIDEIVDDVSKSINEGCRDDSKQNSHNADIEKLLLNSPLPMKKCSIHLKNFIKGDIRNKIMEACNNAIVKKEPEGETSKSKGTDKPSDNRPSRKRKPNSYFSDEFLVGPSKKDFDDYSKIKGNKKMRPLTCQIDHDLVMSVADKCLPEVIDKSEIKEDIKMTSILPPRLDLLMNNVHVLVDWKEKVPIPVYKPLRPQTARTKKKLRTQEEIDREKELLKRTKKHKPKPKCKQKRSPEISPPHLEPYGGQMLDIHSNITTPTSPERMPPNLRPYEVSCSVSSDVSGHKKVARTEGQVQETRVPLSLTGRVRKPNQQLGDYVSALEKPSPKQQGSSKPKSSSSEHITIVHTSSPEKTTPTSLSKGFPMTASLLMNNITSISQNKQPSPQSKAESLTSNKKLTSAIGELAKIENTKKFFQLVVGDKVVLIPTNGDAVMPKAFVMDIAATKPGSHIAFPKPAHQTQKPTIVQQSKTLTVPSSSNTSQSSVPLLSTQSKSPRAMTSPTSVGINQEQSHRTLSSPPILSQTAGIKQEPNLGPLNSPQIIVRPNKSPQQTQPRMQKIVIHNSVPSNSQVLGNQQKYLVRSATNITAPRPQVITVHRTPTSSSSIAPRTPTYATVLTKTAGQRSLLPRSPLPAVAAPASTILFPLVTSSSNNPSVRPTFLVMNSAANFNTVSSSLTRASTVLSPSTNVNMVPTSINIPTNPVNVIAKTSATTSVVSSTPVVKTEPNNIADYEKAAKSFKGVPDDGSDTDSDDETRSAQAQRQSEKCKESVPEVGVHVPAAESETSERIRKLKEKLKEQQLKVESLRKSFTPKETKESGIS